MPITRLALKCARRLGLVCLLLALTAAATAAESGKPDTPEALFAEMRELFAGVGSRSPGMPGNAEMAKRIAERFKASGFETGSVRFRAPVFRPGKAFVEIDGSQPVQIFVMHPTLMRPGNLPKDKLATRLVYLGVGGYDDLERAKGIDLDGAVALMDFGCGNRWLPLMRFGIKAFIFIGEGDGARYDYADSYGKVYNTETATPRFFVPAADGARLKKACEKGFAPAVVTQPVPAKWEVQTLDDLWVLVPGDDEALLKEVVLFTAAYDANSVVPERATGAQSSGNLFLLLKMLDDFKARPPARSVMLTAVNAHTDNFLGERVFAWHLLSSADQVEDVRYAVAREMSQMQLYTAMYERLKLEPTDVDPSDLHLWMEILWQLDAKQQEQRDEEARKKAAAEALANPPPPWRPSWYLITGICTAVLAFAGALFLHQAERPLARASFVMGLVITGVTIIITAWGGKGEKRRDMLRLAEPGADGQVALARPTGPKFEPVLVLKPFTQDDYVQAIDGVVAKLEDERDSFLSSLVAADETIEALNADIESVQALKELSFGEMGKRAERVKTVFDDEKLLESWRIKLDGSTGVRLTIKGKLQDEAKSRLNRLKMKMMAVSKAKATKIGERDLLLEGFRDGKLKQTPEHDRTLEELSEEMAQYDRVLEELLLTKKDMTKVLVLFNKIDIGIGRSRVYYRQIATNQKQLDILRGYRDKIVKDFKGRRAAMAKAVDIDTSNNSVRDALGQKRVALVLSLDVNWSADRVGLCSTGPAGPFGRLRDFGQAAADIAERVKAPDGSRGPFVDAMTRGDGGKDEPYFFHSMHSAAPRFHSAGAVALSVRSAFANDGLAFSPGDTFHSIDPKRVHRVQTWLRKYFATFLDDGGITASKLLPAPKGTMWSVLLRSFTLDQFSGKIVPDLAIPNSLITLYTGAGVNTIQPTLVDGDVANCYRSLSDATGTAILYGVSEITGLASVAYQLDDDFREMLYDIDKGRVQESKQLNSNVVYKESDASRTLPMFRCSEFPVYDRVDPTLIADIPITVQQFWPFSAEKRSAPQKFGTHGIACLSTALSHASVGPVSISVWRRNEEFAPERLLLLTSSKRCSLNASEEAPEGVGFATSDEFGPDFFAWVARDMDKMNRKRRNEMKGITNQLVTDFLGKGSEALVEMEQAEKDRDPNAFVLANYKAVGNETKAYDQIRAMNTDMLKAIVLYMALMLPFCFFVQKLLFGFKRLEHDMLAFVLVFTTTYVVFRFIHPAFRIATQPEAIFIAFVLGAVGCFVIWVLHKRFETEMQLLFRSVTGMSGNVAYSTVGQTAMMIGVNNMKRRRIRTSLTTATIILVVFTMLAFSSVSKKMQPTLINRADKAPYTGIFFHWPAGKGMDEETAVAFKNIYGDRAKLFVRRALQPAVPMLLENVADPTGKTVDVEAIVGLAPEEDGFLIKLPLIHGRFFSSSTAREIILPGQAFEALDIPAKKVGHVMLRIRGEELKLVGVMDDDRYQFMRDLDPEFPLIPRQKIQSQAESVDDAEDPSAQVVNMAKLAFLPSDLSAKLGAQPFTISVSFAPPNANEELDEHLLWKEVTLLLNVTNAKFHIGSNRPFKPPEENAQTIRAGIYYIGSSYRTSIGGRSRLFIPLLIAASIILNTMLGTVYERKYEIAVYNAIGLNPTHIFMFFLAEAFVYGVIGSVAGYLIGQILAMGLKASDIVSGVNVNFSSMMVGYVIMCTIGLVLLSTIYPGIVATRTAVPSGKRKWSLPDHDGNRMRVVFPFIYEPELAPGVMYYLYEYFLTFTEQSIGDQVVSLEDVHTGEDIQGRTLYSLAYSVALAPFDLGVTQSVSFATHFDEVVDSYRVHMTIERVSGQDTNWVTTNKPFLEKLRKLLIGWRNVDPTQHSWYVEQSKDLFSDKERPDKA